jgi:hypothetical protein
MNPNQGTTTPANNTTATNQAAQQQQQQRRTDLNEFLGDMEAGVFAQRVAVALSEAALGVVTTGKPGKVTITFDMKQIADGSQVAIAHKLEFIKPTAKGRVREDNTGKTPFHVGPGGRITLFPENQGDLFGRNQ